jgi:ubiquinone/menaquinone biosynthesis C-methylase UbiE
MEPRGEGGYGRRDQFLDAHAFDSAKARELADRLETLHGSEDERADRSAYLDLLSVGPGRRVLEVGCGNGWVLREIARRVEQPGRAVGLDPSAELLAIAAEEARREGLQVELHEGDARNLPFADDEFDVALAPLVFLHVPDAERVVPELMRVVHHGGKVGVLERDNESFIVAHPDRGLTRRIVHVGTDQTAINAWVGRQLPGMLTRAGLVDVQIKPFARLDLQSSGPIVRFILRWADVAAELGAITAEEREGWINQLYAEEAHSGYLVGVTHLFVWGTRP